VTWNLHGTHACEGDLAELVGLRHKHFILKLVKGGVFHTHRGILRHDELIGMPWGSQVFSHNGSPFFLLQPPIGDVLRELPRNTQIIYPKELGFILVNMGIGPGQHVVEAGTGSGALTCAFAYIIGSEGRVTSYEVRPDMQNMARRNLDRLGLLDRVELKLQSIESGFDEIGVDALFLDLPNPEDYIPQVRCALKSGGFFGSILPTANQVERLLIALRKNDFAFVEVCEIMLRYYKPEPQRFRPTDRMVAHTGYLIFGRPVIIDHSEASRLLLDEAGLVDAQQTPEELDLNHQYDEGTNSE